MLGNETFIVYPNCMNKRILILYTSVGLGHKTIAENIGAHLAGVGNSNEQGGNPSANGGNTVKLFDVLELQSGILVSVGKAVHSFINRRLPFVWKWLYTSKRFTDLTLGSRVKVAGSHYGKVKAVIDEFHPDLVITTQTTASAIIEYMKQHRMFNGKFVIAFSDYHLHRYWLYDSADMYLVNIEEQKQEMVRLGVTNKIPAEKIVVCGMTLMPKRDSNASGISDAINVTAVRETLGFTADDKIILVGSGSLGFGGLSDIMLGALADQLEPHHVKLVVLTGKNTDLKEILEHSLRDHSNIKILGFHTPMDELYAISSMILSKPGGLTVAETLQWSLPMLITHWLPGQEEINYHYLIAKKLVMPKPVNINAGELSKLIIVELEHSAFHQQLATNAERQKIVQAGEEGKAVNQAIENLFHNV